MVKIILKYTQNKILGDRMRNKENKHLGIEIDPQLHAKLKYIAKYEDRSINGQILCLIRACVRDFEAQNGKIEEKDEA